MLARSLVLTTLLSAACADDPPPVAAAEVLFTSAPGSPTGSPTSATIGAAGGSVETPDGKARVTIPEGALSADAQVQLTPITSTLEGGVGGAYRLELGAAAVAKAVTLTLSYDGLTLPSGLGALRPALQLPDGSWLAAGKIVLDESKKTISLSSRLVATGTARRTQAANLKYDVARFEWFHLVPPSATVKTSESLGLAIETRVSQKPPEDPDSLAPIGGADEELAPIAVIKTTPIPNQNQGGSFTWNASEGSVTAGAFGATFTAPGKVPAKNPVAVSARYSGKIFDGMLLVSNVRIVGGAPTFAGPVTFSLTAGEEVTGSADLRFERFEDLPDVARYALLGGTFKATVTPKPGGGLTCDPMTLELAAAEGESNGAIVLWKEGSSEGPKYHWRASSKEREVSFTCRDNKGAAVPYTYNVSVWLDSGPLRAYTDAKFLGGVNAPLEVPLGSGTATWSFDAGP